MKGILKKAIIFIVLIVIIAIVYSVFAKKPEIQGSLTSTPAVGIDDTLSADTQVILTLLQSISNINLSTGIFERPSYLALEDQNKQLAPDLNPGRDNPFAQIGVDQISIPVEVTEQLNILNDLEDPNSGSSAIPPVNDAASTISTSLASVVTKNSAVLNGKLLTANEGAERYFEYGLSQTSLSTSSNKIVQSIVGNFSYTAGNLIPNTMYYFQAVVKIGDVTLRGDIQSFKTLP